jgi:hypothetical protein
VTDPDPAPLDALPPAGPPELAPIRSIGRAQPVDASGCIVNPCAMHLVSAPWRTVADEVLAGCREALGPALHSFYLRGSVPRGLAIDGESDLDAIALLHSAPRAGEAWVRELDARVRRQHPGCRGIELRLWPLPGLAGLSPQHPTRFLLKTQALCLWGPDVTALWPLVPLEAARIVLAALPQALARMRAALASGSGPDAALTRQRCRWLAKKIVRAGFELVALREQAYTRDLYPCWIGFARHHPAQAEAMRAVLALAVEPSAEASRIAAAMALGEWVLAQVGRRGLVAGEAAHPSSTIAANS